MGYKVNRVGTPVLAGATTRYSSHPIVVGDFANLYGVSAISCLALAGTAATARGQYGYRDAGLGITIPDGQGLSLVAPVSLQADTLVTETLVEAHVSGVLKCGSDVGVSGIVLLNTVQTADSTFTSSNDTMFSMEQSRSGDSLSFSSTQVLSITHRPFSSDPDDVAHVGMLITCAGTNGLLDDVRMQVGVRLYEPNDSTYPRYKSPKVQA